MACSLIFLPFVWTASLIVDDVRGQCTSVTTFNTGLTNYVAKVSPRQPYIERAIRQNSADVICLQEVWFERSVKSIISGVDSEYPYHYSKLHSSVGKLRSKRFSWMSWFSPDAACSKSEVTYMVSDVVSCAVRQGCTGGSGQSVGSCLARKCRRELDSQKISQSCLSCTLFSLSSLTDTLAECARVVGTNNRFNGPGLVLLSKKPIRSVRYRNFHPLSKMWVERGYLEAEIQDVGTVLCTHLAASFDDYMEFDTNYKSYEQQQAAEVRAFSRYRYQDHILMGDLNTGPRVSFTFDPKRTVSAIYPKNYKTLLSYGYTNPYADKFKYCTYCKANPYTKIKENRILDHVLLMGQNFRGVMSNRVMATNNGQTLSDHYGVEVRFCRISG